ncbi:hypothetical protein K9M16_05115 [Candidatus Babeliales bacterium]|nr:hypothetical protein [Candidatus Babeliales bacterium]MCF7910749.1 hypothetical protein [Candidatus Pacearchaeota archaeon]
MEKLIEESAKFYFNEAVKEAKKATCLRAKCGAIIINSKGKIIGRGFNSPPKNLESQRRCLIKKKTFNIKITDKTCCIHAEQRAIFNALEKYKKRELSNSILFFARVNEKGKPIPSGELYCTICSKSALDIGIAKWVLQKKEGLFIYNSEEYNNISFNYGKN